MQSTNPPESTHKYLFSGHIYQHILFIIDSFAPLSSPSESEYNSPSVLCVVFNFQLTSAESVAPQLRRLSCDD